MYSAMLHRVPYGGGLCQPLCLCVVLNPELEDGVEDTIMCHHMSPW